MHAFARFVSWSRTRETGKEHKKSAPGFCPTQAFFKINMADGAYSPGPRTPSSFHQRGSHSRSASWSYTSGNSQITLAPLNPIRSVIREFVPSFGHRSPGSRSSVSSPLSPSTYVDLTEVLRDDNDIESNVNASRLVGFANVHSNSGNSSDGDVENGEANIASGNGTPSANANGSGRSASDRMEFQGTISWLEKSLPFVLLLLSRIMWDHRLGTSLFTVLYIPVKFAYISCITSEWHDV